MTKPRSIIPGFCVWAALFAIAWCEAKPVLAGPPLHEAIDHWIDAPADNPKRPASDDAEFARRLYLDLAGRIPSRDELVAFLEDKTPGKRAQLIDQLLADEGYARRMTELFNNMLLERRGDDPHWTAFLRTAFQKNTPWDKFSLAILNPDADDAEGRGAAFFMTSRLVSRGAMAPVDKPGLTRDLGRMFAGVDLQCAQCHDHVSVDDYLQSDFQGLHVAVENLTVRRDVEFPAVSEGLVKAKSEFMSVFTQVSMTTGPRPPGGEEIAIPEFAKGEEYLVPPDRKKRLPGVPRFSPLQELARGLANRDNQMFRRNIVNRLWFTMMGRGLVEPLDLMHSDNPPSHPELLELLASDFAEHDFDMKYLLREIALSNAYQRTSRIDSQTSASGRSYAAANEKRMSAEQLFWSAAIAVGALEPAKAIAQQQAEQARPPADEPPEVELPSTDPVVRLDALERFVQRTSVLASLRRDFVNAFANPATEPEIDFEPSVQGALYLMHDERWLGLLQPQPGNLIDRLLTLEKEKAAEELYLSLFSRRPTAEEQTEAVAWLTQQSPDNTPEQRAAALADIAWAMLSSSEFVINH
ncbi:DUF1553 domain-containing protein [Lignipirellula cremea]|uniref:Cytochrome c domain-containing protein n=1 Tax=Lignipirellula cremea TaxID=2528010 RepID=A0A518DVB2_9BACT|nr:DUF1553 domain-containing protein [Lignipirellula cremea]QDU95770.1 hypothetical protein Pla8534_35870 [Lignipirellula cremea]